MLFEDMGGEEGLKIPTLQIMDFFLGDLEVKGEGGGMFSLFYIGVGCSRGFPLLMSSSAS